MEERFSDQETITDDCAFGELSDHLEVTDKVSESHGGDEGRIEEKSFIRIPSGIQGLDEMVDGGLPYPSTILLGGSSGTGKTTLSLQFMMQCGLKGERGIFFTTFSEPIQWMLRFASRYDFMDTENLDSNIKFVELASVLRERVSDKERYERVLEVIEDEITEHLPQRIVIDPLNVISDMMGGMSREFLYDLSVKLKNWQAVTLLTGEVLPPHSYPFELGYLVDGVIILTYTPIGEGRRRFLEVLKMRGTEHITGKHAMDISRNGCQIQSGLR